MNAKLGRPPIDPDFLKEVITFRMKRIDAEYMVLKAKSLGFTKSKFILKCIEDKLFNIP